ncbi:predicted protein [Plenodomus lingam JN3]|uniref:Predicted protein n=1 Tax=Leptosphaeria maculans (strain JN3 / isolate v23.1.3 / race Av1-4-5-6-7-8) TaxID=985895 RepID=E4ZWK2_LEPMJ|nr:predicted protein [Plenodomus lingam JN3]CBX95978.1 predicted protein [Plenodomus lingam JN3]
MHTPLSSPITPTSPLRSQTKRPNSEKGKVRNFTYLGWEMVSADG